MDFQDVIINKFGEAVLRRVEHQFKDYQSNCEGMVRFVLGLVPAPISYLSDDCISVAEGGFGGLGPEDYRIAVADNVIPPNIQRATVCVYKTAERKVSHVSLFVGLVRNQLWQFERSPGHIPRFTTIPTTINLAGANCKSQYPSEYWCVAPR